MQNNVIKELLYKMADDAFILGHRNSEWTGIGPTIEEDIAFSSMAQDKIGHGAALYTILHEQFGEVDPDTNVYKRSAQNYRCSQFVQLPIGDYAFSLMRHFLFDHAEYLRYQALQNSSFTPLAQLAHKIKGELKYHVLHADTWVRQLGTATEEARLRLQTALNEAFPYALGLFEQGKYETELQTNDIFIGEEALQEQWLNAIEPIIQQANLQLPDLTSVQAVYGGRKGIHTEHLQPTLEEMREVLSVDEDAEW